MTQPLRVASRTRWARTDHTVVGGVARGPTARRGATEESPGLQLLGVLAGPSGLQHPQMAGLGHPGSQHRGLPHPGVAALQRPGFQRPDFQYPGPQHPGLQGPGRQGPGLQHPGPAGPQTLGLQHPGQRGSSILGSRLPGLRSSSISGLQRSATRALGVPGLSAASVRLRPLLALSPASSQGQQTRLALTRHTSSLMLDSIPDVFSLQVLLEESGELFRIPSCRSDMTVRELKEQLDLVAGIPFNLQRLQYLDQEEPLPTGILMDESTLKYHDVDPGGVISLCIWQYDSWTELVLAAVEGDPSKLSCLGVSSEDSSAQTAQMQQLGPEAWRRWVEQRAFVALYITSHRGHLSAVKYLLEHGANCLGTTPLGRTALHVAAAMDRPKCILVLLKHGASVSQKDRYGETPMSLAHKLTQSSVQRRLFLFYWMTKCRALDSRSPGGQKAQPKAAPRSRT